MKRSLDLSTGLFSAILLIAPKSSPAGEAQAAKAAPAPAEAKSMDKSSPKLMAGKVASVNAAAKTFTLGVKGKMMTFSAANLKSMPKVGDAVNVSYTQSNGGPMVAKSINLEPSRSNAN